MISLRLLNLKLLFPCPWASFLFWHIWLARNDSHFPKKDWTSCEVINHATTAFNEYATIHFKLRPQADLSSTSFDPDYDSSHRLLGYISLYSEASLPIDSFNGGIGFPSIDDGGRLHKAVPCSWMFQEAIDGEAIALQ
ncbi:hypothetical protein NE237_011418 [Protea cynaroides]|uniref:Uncharacterized protein n=1 Tax=Protea cynaroides TaxID=273540 RepID=A0A9Q0JXX3_9MAGN|nr:hypothetical protein NE237_011418 [Protea cynaroides]